MTVHPSGLGLGLGRCLWEVYVAHEKTVIITGNLKTYFRGEIEEASQDLGLRLNEFTEHYLVDLLDGFAGNIKGPKPGDALALLYAQALEAPPAEQIRIFRQLGDMALYMAGFFEAFIQQSMVDMDYYIAMGGNAYGNVSELVGHSRKGKDFAKLYQQLAGRFSQLVDLLNEVADKAREKNASDRDLLSLYDRWTRTGSARSRRALVAQGLLPGSGEIPLDYVQ